MRQIIYTVTTAILISLFAASISSAQVVDGSLDAAYGGPLAVQTIETGFGDNASEWNAGYGSMSSSELFLLFTGNLEGNFNKLEIFIDSTNAVTSNVFSGAGNDGANIMNGMTFDTAFTPDYHIIARRGFDTIDKFDIDFANLGAGTFDSYFDIGGGSNDLFAVSTGTGSVNSNPIQVGFNNSNTAGIGGTAGMAADQAAAAAVTTGLELGISLADLGNPTGPIRVMLLQNNDNHDFLSNQTLGGLPVGTGNLGTPANTVDFSSFAGNQFFSIPEPATVGLLGILAMTGLMCRRRK